MYGGTGKTGLLERITELCGQAAQGTGIEIVEVQLRGAGSARLLRIYIDKPNGVTHGDCELISRRVGELLDEDESILEEGYTLEVSSPGIERKLTTSRDYERVVGRKIRVTLRQARDGQLRFEGKLVQVAQNVLMLEAQPEQTISIPLDQVHKANLKFEW